MNDATSPPEDEAPPPSAEPRHSPRRRARIAALVLLLLALPALLYTAFVVAFFETSLGPGLINRRPERMEIRWDSGSMWVPGKIRVQGFVLTADTPRGRFELAAQRAFLDVDLRALGDRVFRVSNALAEGCTVTWTTRSEPRESASPAASTEGSAGDAPRSQGASTDPAPGPSGGPERSDRPPSPWQLIFDDIEIHRLQEVRIDENLLRAEHRPGTGALELRIRPRGTVSVPHLALEMREGRVFLGGQDQGRVDAFVLSADLAPMVPREHRGAGWLRFLTADLKLAAEAWGLGSGFDATSLFLRQLPVAVSGRGRLDAQVLLRQGRLVPGTRVELNGEDVTLDYLDYSGHGSGRLHMVVEREMARLGMRFDRFEAGRRAGGAGPEAPYIEGSGLRLEAESPSLDLLEPTPEARASVILPPSRIPNFAAYDAYLPDRSPVRLVGGQGKVEARFDFTATERRAPLLDGRIRITAEGAEATYEDLGLVGNLELATRVRGHFERGSSRQRLELREGSLVIDDVRVRGSERAPPWWARVEVPRGTVRLGRPLELGAEATAVVSDSRPFVALALKERSMPSWMEQLLGSRSLAVTSDVALDQEHIFLRDLALQGGAHLRARAELRLADRQPTGLMLFQWRKLGLAAELGPGPRRREIKLLDAKDFYAEREVFWDRRFDAEQVIRP